jgi:cellulose synthase/poly-beta-1,6-N-acetylglucosamine synthase-like glycosyltransferase/peptidoglycan/xylan/chitin deacetylase (PgdA/CDA1 family)/spore germination protein YaaH
LGIKKSEMTPQASQVFYSHSGTRWKGFLWFTYIFGLFGIAAIVVVAITLRTDSGISLPRLSDKNETYKKILNPNNPLIFSTKQNELFQKQKNVLHKSNKKSQKIDSNRIIKPSVNVKNTIRGGFYVNWDPQSYYSTIKNIDKINVIYPEWLFVPDGGDTIYKEIDSRALDTMRVHNVQIVPILSNNFNDKWNGGNIDRITLDTNLQNRFIENLVKLLDEYKFSGVNIDFENLTEGSQQRLVNFQKKLYEVLHKRNYLVTQDIAPFNDNYDLTELAKYNDYIVLMSYDEYELSGIAGPISEKKWFKMSIERVLQEIPGNKLVVGLAGYGYDWPNNYEGTDITYIKALQTALESEGKVKYDSLTWNLSYQYYDDADSLHDVFFTDAVTTFNQMRLASKYNIAGFALWRIGSEDERMWKFYNKDLGDTGIKNSGINFEDFKTSSYNTEIDYEGEGELLDIEGEPQKGEIDIEYDAQNYFINSESYKTLPLSYVVREFGKGNKQMLLTFDDGPDPEYTPQILDILKEKKVPATFFVVGINVENNIPLLKRIYDDGFEIGNHTFTHPNIAEVGLDRANMEINATRRIIESITGHSTILFRPPYNADSQPETMEEILPISIAKKDHFYTLGESVDPEDWREGVTADSIFARIVREQNLGSVILLHDAGGDRSQTIKALPRIIDYFQDKGYKFITVSELLGVNKDVLMPPIEDSKDYFYSKTNYYTAETVFYIEQFFGFIFISAIILSVIRMIFIGIFALRQKRYSLKYNKLNNSDEKAARPVSIIIPALNEEVNSVRTINNLLASDYCNLEICFVDDGSTDNTYSIVSDAFKNNPKVKIFKKPNGGKASALNYGIKNSRGEIMVCIDADTHLKKDAVTNLVKYFDDDKIGAVAGNVKVGNEVNLLTKWQSIEYITSQNFERRTFDILNCITVVPGAIGAFRKSAILEIGGFNTDTMAEDCDATISLLVSGYVVRFSDKAIAMTEAPETLKMFMKQRFRWSYGIMQSVWKHRSQIFRSHNKPLGFIALPNIYIFQILLPFLAPVADLMMVFAILAGNMQNIIAYYFIFLFVDTLGSAIAFSLEKEKIWRLWTLIPQRFVYRQLMFIVVARSILTAIKGSLMEWGLLKRTGNVRVVET